MLPGFGRSAFKPAPTSAVALVTKTGRKAVAEMRDETAMRPRTLFAARAGTAEPDRVQHLPPVDQIEPAVFGGGSAS